MSCPGSSAAKGTVCGGVGTCHPNGTCTCDTQNYAQPDCLNCIPGKTGPLCEDDCPHNGTRTGDPQKESRAPCSDHGKCERTQTCSCYAGYAHPQNTSDWLFPKACQAVCPGIGAPIVSCSGNGECDPDTNTCMCFDNDTYGHWDGAGCDVCAVGWSGAPRRQPVERKGCTLECPKAAGVVCNSHGVCLEGECFCDFGWCGDKCEQQSADPGTDCNACPVGQWGHSDCSKLCPGSAQPNDKGCSNKGECRERKDIPQPNAPNPCVCVPGRGGDDCSKECPQSGGVPCGGPGRGSCDPDTLVCQCKVGFAGVACEMTCPRDPQFGQVCGGNLCYDNSFCLSVGGEVCTIGTCAKSCATDPAVLPDAFPPGSALGQCNCSANIERKSAAGAHKGRVGAQCANDCDCTAMVNGVVTDTGTCMSNGSCACDTWYNARNYSGGNWVGTTPDDCTLCLPGFYGEACNLECGGGPNAGANATGETARRKCRCFEYWSQPDCSAPCFGVDPDTRQPGPMKICSGHGTCQWGGDKSGLCACDVIKLPTGESEAYYPPGNCTVRCSKSSCGPGGAGSVRNVWNNVTNQWDEVPSNDGGLENPQCNPVTGACECQDDQTGHYAGAQCTECKLMYWGSDCTSVCDCSGNGGCDAYTGECQCFGEKWGNGDLYGYWDGGYCERCADGFIGMTCRGRNVRITRTNTVDPRKTMKTDVQSALWVDEEQAFIYAGSRPMVAISTRVKAGMRSSFPTFNSISGTALGCNSSDADPDEGTTFHVFGYETHVYFLMQPDAARGCPMRIMSMPRAVSSVNFTFAAEVLRTPSLPADAVIVSAHKARAGAVLAVVLLSGPPDTGRYYLRRFDLLSGGKVVAAESVDPQHLNSAEYGLATITHIALDHSGDNAFLAGSRNTTLTDSWGVLWVPKRAGAGCGGAMSPDKVLCLLSADTHDVTGPTCESGCRLAMLVRYFEADGRRTLLVPLRSSRRTATGLAQLVIDTSCRSNCMAFAEPIIDDSLTATALEVDAATEVAYITVNQPSQPSTVYKFEFNAIAGPKMYGRLDLTWSITTSSGFVAETVSALHAAEDWRIMYSLTTGTKVLRLIPLLLYEIRSVSPPLADTKAGTRLLLSGRGFRTVNLHGPEATGAYDPVCRLAEDGQPIPATIVKGAVSGAVKQGDLRETEMLCIATALNSSMDELSCDGDPIEVSLYNTSSTYTDNRIKLRRVQSAVLNATSGAVPRFGFYTGVSPAGGRVLVNLTGFGFQEDRDADGLPSCPDCLACKFYSENQNDAVVSAGAGNVTYVSPYEMTCAQPPTPEGSIDPSFVDVSLDGQTFSGKPVPFTIVGPATGLWVDPSWEFVAHWAVNVTDIPVFVVDAEGHKLERFDELLGTGTRAVSVSVDWYTPDELVDGQQNLTLTTVNGSTGVQIETNTKTRIVIPNDSVGTQGGKSVFAGLVIEHATTGLISLSFRTDDTRTDGRHAVPMALGSWVSSAILRVVVGAPHHMKIKQQPSSWTDFKNKLVQQPRLVVVDEIENEIRETNVTFAVLCTVLSTPENQTDARTYENSHGADESHEGEIVFEDITVKGRFGAVYRLAFRCKEDNPGCCPNKKCWQPLVSRDIHPRLCSGCERVKVMGDMCEAKDGAQYQVLGTDSCEDCPSGGLCNGSAIIYTKPGWWRPSGNSTRFYECKANPAACVGAAPGMNPCSNITGGPLCAVCSPGYGKSPTGGCAVCQEGSKDLILVIVVIVAVIVGLVVWIVITLRKNKDSAVSIITRMIVSHLQVVGKLGEFSVQWAPFLKELFDMQSSGSQVSVSGLSAIDCTMRDHGYNAYHYFTGYMLMPVLPLLIACLVYGFIVVRRTVNPSLNAAPQPDEDKTKSVAGGSSNAISNDDGVEMRELSTRKMSGPGRQPSERELTVDPDAEFDDPEAEETNNIYSYNFVSVLLTTYCVCLFVLYPTLITQAALMISCDPYSVEIVNTSSPLLETVTLETRNFLRIDRSIDCDTGTYQTYRTAASACLVGYGLGIPLVFVLLVRRVIASKSYKEAYIMFIFLLGGFTEKMWFWQAVIMIRKLAMGLIAVFVVVDDDADTTNDALQSYCAMWAMSLALVVHLWCKPYDPYGDAPYNGLETMSLGVLVFMLNAGLLYYWKDLQEKDSLRWARDLLTATLIIVTFVCLVVFVYYLVRYGWLPMAVELADKDCDGQITARDLRILFRLEKILPDISKLDDASDEAVRLIAEKMGVQHMGYELDEVRARIRAKHAEGLDAGQVDEATVAENKRLARQRKRAERERKEQEQLEQQRKEMRDELEEAEEDNGDDRDDEKLRQAHKALDHMDGKEEDGCSTGGPEAPNPISPSSSPPSGLSASVFGRQQTRTALQQRYWPPTQQMSQSTIQTDFPGGASFQGGRSAYGWRGGRGQSEQPSPAQSRAAHARRPQRTQRRPPQLEQEMSGIHRLPNAGSFTGNPQGVSSVSGGTPLGASANASFGMPSAVARTATGRLAPGRGSDVGRIKRFGTTVGTLHPAGPHRVPAEVYGGT
eukprot:TRINITY_DN3098_c0_g2_i1.p1 TRINITY_DN3098_c0_g2~~TRINITY_DN3098_c0_g2_i1.p1  ORF type:complete len:2836 (+),score=615.43 TRINITY_DN3098_c0_g2_i1:955-8508(+)